MSNTILLTTANAVATITFNRPDKYNSFTKDMVYALQQALETVRQDATIRALVITATGKAFCAGQDLAEATSAAFPGFETVVSQYYNPIVLAIKNLPIPVIAIVNGVAAGAGANLALACDIVFAADTASFVQAFSKIGLVPDSGGTHFLPRLIGAQQAAALMFTGDKLMATDAAAMGMIYKALPAEIVVTEAMAFATKLAAMPTKGLALTKQLLHASATNTLEQQLALECELQVQAGNTHDYKEGVAAFLEKRQPNFKGN